MTMRNQTETTPRFKVKFKLIFERLLEIILKEDDEFNGLQYLNDCDKNRETWKVTREMK